MYFCTPCARRWTCEREDSPLGDCSSFLEDTTARYCANADIMCGDLRASDDRERMISRIREEIKRICGRIRRYKKILATLPDTAEWVLWKAISDSIEDIKALVRVWKGVG